MGLTGHGTIKDMLIVVGIIIGVAVVATVIVRGFIFGRSTSKCTLSTGANAILLSIAMSNLPLLEAAFAY